MLDCYVRLKSWFIVFIINCFSYIGMFEFIKIILMFLILKSVVFDAVWLIFFIIFFFKIVIIIFDVMMIGKKNMVFVNVFFLNLFFSIYVINMLKNIIIGI